MGFPLGQTLGAYINRQGGVRSKQLNPWLRRSTSALRPEVESLMAAHCLATPTVARTDASLAVRDGHCANGVWPERDPRHINVLELDAIRLALRSFNISSSAVMCWYAPTTRRLSRTSTGRAGFAPNS